MKIDLGKYAGQEEDTTEVMPLAKCPDRNARIGFRVRTKLIAEDVQDADTFSQMSGFQSVESDGDFWQNDDEEQKR